MLIWVKSLAIRYRMHTISPHILFGMRLPSSSAISRVTLVTKKVGEHRRCDLSTESCRRTNRPNSYINVSFPLGSGKAWIRISLLITIFALPHPMFSNHGSRYRFLYLFVASTANRSSILLLTGSRARSECQRNLVQQVFIFIHPQGKGMECSCAASLSYW
ncbi:hypothetical protein BGZ60DRAFT_233595 [Tricladium varicosporioides]|nr:hypothetical protein BGZ60DRAFT_233595 [Hymenoscyphus varicosporioides]